jgi:hypothetical protein
MVVSVFYFINYLIYSGLVFVVSGKRVFELSPKGFSGLDLYRGKHPRCLLRGAVSMPTGSGLVPMKYDYFFNQHCALVLIYTERDLAKPKRRYVFREIA